MKEIDVLIVGAGPVGLQMGLCLAREGVSFAIIDKKSGPTTTSNAVGVNSRTMEIWRSLGFLDEAIKRGLKVYGTSLYTDKKLLNKIHFDVIKSDFQFNLALPQAHTEQLLIEELAAKNITVNWNHELTELSQTAESAQASCKTPAGNVEYLAKWVIGCDGYHSKVRDSAAIERACHDLPLHFLMVDAEASGSIGFDTVNLLFHNHGMIFTIPMRNSIRVVAEISTDAKYKDTKVCDPDIFRQIIHERYPDINIGRVDWCSAFYIHECLANQYRQGRIFLAGDAAHTHSPMGGQGMNTGLQDTWNLAWKLAMVIHGKATEKLLDSYESERRAVGHDVLERSRKLTAAATTNNFLLKFLRDFGIQHIVDLDPVRSKMANGISQTNICYHNSTLVNHKQVEKYGILKHPEYQSGWTILITSDNQVDGFPDFMSIKTVATLPDNFKFCLVRPDGYTAMYTNDLTDLQTYFLNNYITLY